MTTLREAAQQALEALEYLDVNAAIKFLRAALAQQEHITDGTPCWCNPEITHIDPETKVLLHKGTTGIGTLTADHQTLAQQEHITDGTPCWCNPELDYVDPETGAKVWVHKEPQWGNT